MSDITPDTPDFAILPTGQIWFMTTNEHFLDAAKPGISPIEFQTLMMVSQLGNASVHSKPQTDSCETAVMVRIPNDFAVEGIGTELSRECKGRIFMARDTFGDDVVIANFYMADSKLDFRKLAQSLPKDAGYSLIEIPQAVKSRPKGNFDAMDLLSLEDPYKKASAALGLGLGEINPFSVVLQAKERGVKLLCVYDEELLKQHGYLTNNAGSRTLGIYAPNGVDYIELAIANTQAVEIGGNTVNGYIVADIAERDKNLQAPSALRNLYGAADSFEAALRAANRGFTSHAR